MVRLFIYFKKMNNNQNKIALWVKKAIWTLNKVITMIEKDAYCADVAQQINSSIWLLRAANNELLKDHLACCGKKALSSNSQTEAQEFINEFIRVWDMSNRK